MELSRRLAPSLLAVFLGLVSSAAPEPLGAVQRDSEEALRVQPSAIDARPLGRSVRQILHRTATADPDHDGLVSRTEATAYFEQLFALMDIDRDGQLTGTEFVQFDRAGVEKHRPLQARLKMVSAFAELDLDNDGVLSPEEFHRALASDKARDQSQAERTRRWREAIFQRLDHDGDDLISKQQFLAAGRRHFERTDRDGDERVSVWEFLGRLGL